MIDLHTHSIYSDGTNTPGELVAMANERGLTALALTDHDTVGGIAELFEAAASTALGSLARSAPLAWTVAAAGVITTVLLVNEVAHLTDVLENQPPAAPEAAPREVADLRRGLEREQARGAAVAGHTHRQDGHRLVHAVTHFDAVAEMSGLEVGVFGRGAVVALVDRRSRMSCRRRHGAGLIGTERATQQRCQRVRISRDAMGLGIGAIRQVDHRIDIAQAENTAAEIAHVVTGDGRHLFGVIESAGHRGVRGVLAILLMQRRHNLSILGKGFTVITFDPRWNG